MASEYLVRSEIDAGLNLIKALDSGKFGVAAALWLYKSETERWRMVIAYRGDEAELREKHLQATMIARQWRADHPDEPILDLARVSIVSADDPLIQGLKPVGKVDGLHEMRVSHRLVSGIYVEDAIIHRLAA
jgi:hypothetical protein